MSITASEHCFDFIDAKHDTEASNRYWFDYPEFWFSNQDLCDLSVGLRSVILKTSPLYIYIENLFVDGINNIPENELIPTNPDSATWTNCYKTCDYDGSILYPSRMLLNYQIHVDEKMDMNSFCDNMKNWYKNKYNDWQHLIELHEKKFYRSLQYDSVQFYYNEAGDFVMTVDDPKKRCFTYLQKRVDDFHKDPDNPDFYHPVNIFSDSFQQLLGIDLKRPELEFRDLNKILNSCFHLLRRKLEVTEEYEDGEISKESYDFRVKNIETNIKTILDTAAKHGIYINNLKATRTDILASTYDWKESLNKWTQTNIYDSFSFTSITIKNVWSRKDIRLESSMSEYDLHHYLGYSSYNSNTSTYPQPKIFEIKSRVNKFWINLYDGYTKNPIELPEGISLLMETQLYQSDKPPLNNNF